MARSLVKVRSASTCELGAHTEVLQANPIQVGRHFGVHHVHNVTAAAPSCDPSVSYTFTRKHVITQSDKLATNKGVGLDDIQEEVIKAAREESATFLTPFP